MQKTKKNVFFLVVLSVAVNGWAASRAPAIATQAMVASSHHLASAVGKTILQQGGNAVDAAVAMGYALAVVHPCCGNLGGGGFMLIRQPTGKSIFLNFREKAPLAIKPTFFLDADGHVQKEKLAYGYLAVGVPGTVMGLNTALKRYGTMTLMQVMQPAISLAQKGFLLQAGDVDFFSRSTEAFKKSSNVAAVFLNAKQQAKGVGERLQQPQLARTLSLIAQQGSDVFYRGVIAKKIVAASHQHGGLLSLQDFKKYTITEERPVVCHYHEYTVISAPPPSSGGTTLCQILTILSAYPLKKLGYHSAQSVHYTTEAMRYAFADRNAHLGDPAFVNNPIQRLIDPEYAAQIRQKINATKAGDSNNVQQQLQRLRGETPSLQPSSKRLREEQYTTHYSVVAGAEAVSVTYTLDAYFGAKVIAGDTGFFLNNELGDFAVKVGHANAFQLVQGEANLMAPGKRPLSSMTPTLVLKDNNLFLVVGATGGSTIISTVLGVIQNVIDYGLNIQEAVDAPRFHMQWLPDTLFMEPRTFSKDTQANLEKMGYDLRLGSPYRSLYWGAANAVQVDQPHQRLYGAADSRRQEGLATGY